MAVTRRGLTAWAGDTLAAHIVWQRVTRENQQDRSVGCLRPIVCRANDAAELVASSPGQQGSSSSCRAPAYEMWENWREGMVGLLKVSSFHSASLQFLLFVSFGSASSF